MWFSSAAKYVAGTRPSVPTPEVEPAAGLDAHCWPVFAAPPPAESELTHPALGCPHHLPLQRSKLAPAEKHRQLFAESVIKGPYKSFFFSLFF